MTLRYISHSCFVVESGGHRLAFDPWITPSAYLGQWYLHPKPMDITPVTGCDVVLISHGHDDHLNQDSLKLINKNAHIYFPFQWREGIVSYLNHLGFSGITEAETFKTYKHGPFSVTYLGYSLESVIVVECEGLVIVNINDALNSNHETAVNFLLKEIKDRWPHIDYMLSGWSGAGYFPNKVHYPGKDDMEVAQIREQYFANNFCRFAQALQPEIAIPFAPGFVLLTKNNRWINEIKFPRRILDSYYRKHFEENASIKFPVSFPGDYFSDKEFHPVSPYHQVGEKEMYKSLDHEFSEEIKIANNYEVFSEASVSKLHLALEHWLGKNCSIYHNDVIDDVVFSIRMKDVEQNPFFNISFLDKKPVVKRSTVPSEDDRLLIEVDARLVSLNLEKEWGGDLLSIGYGTEVWVYEERSLEKNLDLVCMRLISRFPILKDDFIRHSGRMLKYYLGNPAIANLWIRQKIKLRPYVNKYPFNERDHWLTYNKCDLCKVCHMPQFDFEKNMVN